MERVNAPAVVETARAVTDACQNWAVSACVPVSHLEATVETFE